MPDDYQLALAPLEENVDHVRGSPAGKDLLARAGTLVLTIHAIDRQPTPTPANVQVDIVDLFDGADPYARIQLRDPADWQNRITPALQAAARDLEAYATRRVHRLDAAAAVVRGRAGIA